MKKTEYFISQTSWNQLEPALIQVKQKRNEFISSTKIEKIIDEDIKITGLSSNLIILVIKLTYY